MRPLFLRTLIFVTCLFSSHAFPDDRISENDDKQLAFECVKSRPGGKRAFSYWPAQILEINEDGAVVSQTVRKKWHLEEGGNNGWSEANKYTSYSYVECIWHGVAKGKYSVKPSYSLVHWKEGKLPSVYTYVISICKSSLCDYRREEGFREFQGKPDEDTSFWNYIYPNLEKAEFGYNNRLPSGPRVYKQSGHN